MYMWFAVFNDDGYKYLNIQIVLELIFSITMYTKFFTDFIPEGESISVKNGMIIAKRYLNNGFI